MKTDEFIDFLARQAGAAPERTVARTLGTALVAGALSSLVLVWAIKTPVPATFWLTPAPWLKVIYGSVLAATALWWTARLARPGTLPRAVPVVLPVVIAVMLSLALVTYVGTPASARVGSLMGSDPLGCILNVAMSALPVAAAFCFALRRLAPTHLRSAGAAAGLAAGAVGSVAYSLSCTEAGVPFVAVWYTAGMLAVAGAGALLGPRLLRW